MNERWRQIRSCQAETWEAMRMWLTRRTRSTGEKPQRQRES